MSDRNHALRRQRAKDARMASQIQHIEQLDELCGDELMEYLQQDPEGNLLLPTSGYPCTRISNATAIGEPDPSSMSVDFTIVTRGAAINRNGHKVQIAPDADGKGGFLMQNYARNPVVLFDHGYSFSLPIGISENPTGELAVKLMKTRADATAFFSQRLAEAAQIFALVDEKILRTASVGFIPLRAKPLQDQSRTQSKPGEDELDLSKPWISFDFLENELLEWSIVPIPADPGAVRKHLELGHIRGERITQALRPTLKRMASPAYEQTWGIGWSPARDAVQDAARDPDTGALDLPDELDEAFEDLVENPPHQPTPAQPAPAQPAAEATSPEEQQRLANETFAFLVGQVASSIAKEAIGAAVAEQSRRYDQLGQKLDRALGAVD